MQLSAMTRYIVQPATTALYQLSWQIWQEMRIGVM